MEKHVNIQVDDRKVKLDKTLVTGLELKQLINIPQNVELFLSIKDAADKEILNEETYDLDNGMIFFSALHKHSIKVYIDHIEYNLEKSDFTGVELKAIANIPTVEYKLVKENRHGADTVVEDNIIYHIEDKDEFFSIPTGIQNGGYI